MNNDEYSKQEADAIFTPEVWKPTMELAYRKPPDTYCSAWYWSELCQKWVSNTGKEEWRPIRTI